jgi:hypothetical protein
MHSSLSEIERTLIVAKIIDQVFSEQGLFCYQTEGTIDPVTEDDLYKHFWCTLTKTKLTTTFLYCRRRKYSSPMAEYQVKLEHEDEQTGNGCDIVFTYDPQKEDFGLILRGKQLLALNILSSMFSGKDIRRVTVERHSPEQALIVITRIAQFTKKELDKFR